MTIKPRCLYRGNDTGGVQCERAPVKGWTTCAKHYSAGRSTNQKLSKSKVPGTSRSI